MNSHNETGGTLCLGQSREGVQPNAGDAEGAGDHADGSKSLTELRSSEIRYRRLFEAARDGILLLDPITRKITDANPFMSELLGYPEEVLIGKELWEIGLLKDEETSKEAFRILQDKSFIRYEDLPLQTKAGHRREVEFVSNVYQEDGHAVIQCNIREITVRKRTEATLRQARDQLATHAADLERVVSERTAELRETIGELEAFSYSMSHDLRAPLRAMQGFARLLLDDHSDQLDALGHDYLERIARSSARLDSLIRDVLNYTRLLHSPVPLGCVELNEVVHDVIRSYPDWQPPKVEIEIQSPLPAVLGHEGFLTQCISNLVSNAVKFVAHGITPRVRIWTESIGGAIQLFIQDNGVGIALEDHGRIFRMFERIHPAAEFEGTGIGLTIARKAVERMGGAIGFESQPSRGSRFWLKLQPVRPQEKKH